MKINLLELATKIDAIICKERPHSFDECADLVAKSVDTIAGKPNKITTVVKTVSYYGYRNGVKVFLRRGRQRVQTNSKGTVYAIHQ